MKKRKYTEEHENVDRWMVSYADFVTLLFAFFTTLYAISRVDAGKLSMFAGSMKYAFSAQGTAAQKPIIEGIVPVPPDVAAVEKEVRGIVDSLALGDNVNVRRDARGVIISLGDKVLFDSGQSDIKEAASPALSALAAVIRKFPNAVVVEGHTDNTPVKKGVSRLNSNWELSVARATSVLLFFIEKCNIPPERLSASGYAEFRPVALNESPEGRAKNRRVDIILSGTEGISR